MNHTAADPRTSAAQPSNTRQRWALAALCLAMLMASLDTSIAHAALPTLARVFDASFRQAQWIILVYLLAVTLLSVGAGRAGDAFGRRRVLMAGIALFTLASLLCALAPTLAMLLAARALQGAGAAVMVPLALAFVADVAPGPSRGRAMGLLGTMSAAGTTLGPALGGLLLALGGWPAIFMINVPLGILNLFLIYQYLPQQAAQPAAPPAAGLLRIRAAGASLAMAVLVSVVLMSTLVVGPFYLGHALGLGAGAAGLVLAAGPLIAALAGVPAGLLVDRFGAAALTWCGLAAIAAGCMALAILPSGVASYIGGIAVVTLGYALFQAANITRLMAAVPAPQRGAAAGLLGLARNGGLIAGTAVMGALFAAGWGSGGAAEAAPGLIVQGMRTTFAAGAVLMLLALAIARFSRPARP